MQRCSGDRWALACLAILFVAGCSGETVGGPDLSKLVPVKGIVTLDDKPLADATVAFHPKTKEGFQGAIGTTDASGKYELVTEAGNGKTVKGVLPGFYQVTVSKMVKQDGTPFIYKGEPGGPMSMGAVESIPMLYATVSERGLSFDVPAGGGTYDIKMEPKGPGEL